MLPSIVFWFQLSKKFSVTGEWTVSIGHLMCHTVDAHTIEKGSKIEQINLEGAFFHVSVVKTCPISLINVSLSRTKWLNAESKVRGEEIVY